MKAVLAAGFALLVWVPTGPVTGTARADPGTGAVNPNPPFVGHTEWTQSGRLASLRVFPTPSGRLASREPNNPGAADEAWAEVLAMAPNADTPGMHAQFICHWQFAELAQPGKTSWNLEPWRPVVDDAEMAASGCNPGGPEEPN
ncbi:DUF2599 domain-containing protein [Mycobacterium ahvazicum]|uniref:DUF2599 domain-containing protein n=1 Tax=Mycobacterium ahvazicum TaxID=1964395 RepID=UPI000BB8C6E5|nr:DUF2599 domain-containing protein [Mycobacterium ahvazicum]